MVEFLREASAAADELVRRASLPPGEVASALVELELAGVAETVDGFYRTTLPP